MLNIDEANINEEQKQELLDILESYSDVFSKDSDDIGQTNHVQHRIDTGNSHPIREGPRRTGMHQREEVKEQVAKMLKQGVIEPSNSPWSSPIVLVKKKDGSTRFCVDYRQLNDITKKDAYPLPRIDDALDTLSEANIFTTLDLTSGYWQIGMHPEDREKTAFATHSGLFEFKVMPFGLCNAPATFQRLMEFVLAGLNWSTCLVYLDDVIIFSRTFDEHVVRLKEILQRIRDAGLKLKPVKCHFLKKEVVYLGHLVSNGGLSPDPSKCAAVREYPIPTNVQEVRSFLGLASYYRRFIRDFAKIASPLHRLTEKGKNFKWNEEHQEAFEKLKQHLISPPILALPRFRLPFRLDTDASDYGIGAVLSQIHDGQERVIAYASRHLNKTERTWYTTEKEALAMVWAVEQFHPYLYGRKFTLLTDHQPLKWLKSLKNPKPRLARWMITLQEYEFEVEYRPGKNHGNADALSRIPVNEERSEEEVPVMVVSDNPPIGTALHSSWSTEDLVKLQHEDPDVRNILTWKENGSKLPPKEERKNASPETKRLLQQWNKLVIKDQMLHKEWKPGRRAETQYQIVVPKQLRPDILRQLHDDPASSHLGQTRTLDKVRRRFFWPRMEEDVRKYCRECPKCSTRKPPHQQERMPMKNIPINRPFSMVATDVVGPFPVTANGNKYILVVTDYFTKWPEAYAVPNQEAETVARMLVDFVSRHGVPEVLLSDQGRNFESNVMKKLCELLCIEKRRTTPYHPQCDGLVERFNRTLETMLSMYVADNHKDWDLHIAQVLLAYRSSVHDSTRETPFSLLYGREARLPVDACFPTADSQVTSNDGKESHQEYVVQLRSRMEKVFSMVQERLLKSQCRQKKYYDEKVHGKPYEVGDRVWLSTPVKKKGLSPKFLHPWSGPYTIERKTSECNYEIVPDNGRRKILVHHNRLKPCASPKLPSKERPVPLRNLNIPEVEQSEAANKSCEPCEEEIQLVEVVVPPMTTQVANPVVDDSSTQHENAADPVAGRRATTRESLNLRPVRERKVPGHLKDFVT